MTDRDNSSDGSSEGFLMRWSRTKAEAAREASGMPAEPRAAGLSAAEPALPVRCAVDGDKSPDQTASKSEFDLASLPSLDSITGTTDIRAFLSPGVPNDLARAALRRTWSADPAIRNFKGLAENDWDFTDPTAMAGFGELPPGYDIKKMVAQIFGEVEKRAEPGADAEQPADPEEAHNVEEIAPPASPATVARPVEGAEGVALPDLPAGDQQIAQSNFLHHRINTAPHNSFSNDETDRRKNRRQHGGALPQ